MALQDEPGTTSPELFAEECPARGGDSRGTAGLQPAPNGPGLGDRLGWASGATPEQLCDTAPVGMGTGVGTGHCQAV